LLRSVYITRFLSGFLLLVFAFSITPKRILHDLFANHVDNVPGKNSNSTYHVIDAGFNCDNDHLVVESSFLGTHTVFSILSIPVLTSYVIKDIPLYSSSEIISSLRGPPVNI
jgi:hypothetical protein